MIVKILKKLGYVKEGSVKTVVKTVVEKENGTMARDFRMLVRYKNMILVEKGFEILTKPFNENALFKVYEIEGFKITTREMQGLYIYNFQHPTYEEAEQHLTETMREMFDKEV